MKYYRISDVVSWPMILTIWVRHLPFILMKQRLSDDQAVIIFYTGLRRRALKHLIFRARLLSKILEVCDNIQVVRLL